MVKVRVQGAGTEGGRRCGEAAVARCGEAVGGGGSERRGEATKLWTGGGRRRRRCGEAAKA